MKKNFFKKTGRKINNSSFSTNNLSKNKQSILKKILRFSFICDIILVLFFGPLLMANCSNLLKTKDSLDSKIENVDKSLKVQINDLGEQYVELDGKLYLLNTKVTNLENQLQVQQNSWGQKFIEYDNKIYNLENNFESLTLGDITSEYEFIQKIIVGYSVLTEEPSDWTENYSSYYKNTGTLREPVYTGLSETETFVSGQYYSYSDARVNNFELYKEPDGTNWSFKKLNIIVTVPVDAPANRSGFKVKWNCEGGNYSFDSVTLREPLKANEKYIYSFFTDDGQTMTSTVSLSRYTLAPYNTDYATYGFQKCFNRDTKQPEKMNYIKSIILYGKYDDGYWWDAGTQFEIYGVR